MLSLLLVGGTDRREPAAPQLGLVSEPEEVNRDMFLQTPSRQICSHRQHKYTQSVTLVSMYTLGLVCKARLAHQSDLCREAPCPSVLQQTRHSIVVEVADEIADPSLVSRSQLLSSQRGQCGAHGSD